MKPLITLLLFLSGLVLQAQTMISGTVTDTKGQPLVAASIYIDGTYDGGTTDDKGQFSFETTAAGSQILVISFLFYEDIRKI